MNKFKWTDTKVSFVELINALQDARCINNGNTSLKDLFSFLGTVFNIHITDYYRYFTDITHRKGDDDNRTLFLNKLKAALNNHISKSDSR